MARRGAECESPTQGHGSGLGRYHAPEVARRMPKSTPLADEVAPCEATYTRSKSTACSTEHAETADRPDPQSGEVRCDTTRYADAFAGGAAAFSISSAHGFSSRSGIPGRAAVVR